MKKEAREYLKLAIENLEEGKKALGFDLLKSAMFWSQQSIELFLKAFLINNELFEPIKHRTHNLLFLLKECIKVSEDFNTFVDKLKTIKKVSYYAVTSRYDPNFLKMYNKTDAEEAITLAEQIKEFVLKELEKKINNHN